MDGAVPLGRDNRANASRLQIGQDEVGVVCLFCEQDTGRWPGSSMTGAVTARRRLICPHSPEQPELELPRPSQGDRLAVSPGFINAIGGLLRLAACRRFRSSGAASRRTSSGLQSVCTLRFTLRIGNGGAHFYQPRFVRKSPSPTPVSAYLHSATMVKAGVYLLMRVSPMLGDTPLWETVLPVFGGFTFVFGAVVGLRQTDMKQMLAYSGRGRFVVQKVDLNRLVEETTQLLQISISKQAVLRFNLAKGLPGIEVDATQVRQVVMNLVINASEAIGEKSGVISLSTGL
eukprot:gene38588-52128_t